ncbi:MAG: lysophospholipid acyltransferase family protein [Desulfobacteraceae bacterium]
MDLLSSTLKILWLSFWLGLATLILAPLVTASALLGSTGNFAFNLTRVWAWIILGVTGCRPGICGKEKIRKGQPYIIITNHQSHFDALALVTTLGIQFRWVAKRELLRIPLFGQALYAARNIFVDRSNTQKAIKSIEDGIKRLPPGASILFFAEGSRSADGKLQAFKKGGFVTAIGTGLPVLPVAVKGSRKVLPKGSLVFHPGLIKVVVGEPIHTVDYTGEKLGELMKRTSEVIASNLKTDHSGQWGDGEKC